MMLAKQGCEHKGRLLVTLDGQSLVLGLLRGEKTGEVVVDGIVEYVGAAEHVQDRFGHGLELARLAPRPRRVDVQHADEGVDGTRVVVAPW